MEIINSIFFAMEFLSWTANIGLLLLGIFAFLKFQNYKDFVKHFSKDVSKQVTGNVVPTLLRAQKKNDIIINNPNAKFLSVKKDENKDDKWPKLNPSHDLDFLIIDDKYHLIKNWDTLKQVMTYNRNATNIESKKRYVTLESLKDLERGEDLDWGKESDDKTFKYTLSKSLVDLGDKILQQIKNNNKPMFSLHHINNAFQKDMDYNVNDAKYITAFLEDYFFIKSKRNPFGNTLLLTDKGYKAAVTGLIHYLPIEMKRNLF